MKSSVKAVSLCSMDSKAIIEEQYHPTITNIGNNQSKHAQSATPYPGPACMHQLPKLSSASYHPNIIITRDAIGSQGRLTPP